MLARACVYLWPAWLFQKKPRGNWCLLPLNPSQRIYSCICVFMCLYLCICICVVVYLCTCICVFVFVYLWPAWLFKKKPRGNWYLPLNLPSKDLFASLQAQNTTQLKYYILKVLHILLLFREVKIVTQLITLQALLNLPSITDCQMKLVCKSSVLLSAMMISWEYFYSFLDVVLVV